MNNGTTLQGSLATLACAVMMSGGATSAYALDSALTINAYVDCYYATDNDEADVLLNDKTVRQLNTVGVYKNQFGVNLAQISAAYSRPDVRARVTLHAGTLRTIGWDGLTDHPVVQEANAGVRVADGLWVDAGFFLGHIGGEFLTPKDNWVSSHSLVTLFEPFYESGVRVSYAPGGGVDAQIFLVNGYNLIADDNDNLSGGLYAAYTGDNVTISYAGHYGNELNYAVGGYSLRLYNNVVLWARIADGLEVKGQVDFAVQNDAPARDETGMMTGALLTLRYALDDSWSVAVRGEYLDDDDRVVSPGLKGMGVTGSLEFRPTANSYMRAEGRMITLDEEYKPFIRNREPVSSKVEAMVTFGVWI